MMSLYLLAGVAVAYGISTVYSRLQANTAQARASGLTCIVAPWSPGSVASYVLHKLWMPIVKLVLPRSWWETWLEVMIPDIFWKTGNAFFEKYGGMFIVASAQRNHIILGNAEVIHQVLSNLERFPKDLARYDSLRLFGENLLTADVGVWRLHRKLVSGSFNEQNAALVFHEAIRHSKRMIGLWTDANGERKQTLRTLEHDTNRLALNIISFVGLGISLLWPGETLPEDTSRKLTKYASAKAPPGYGLSFVDAVRLVLDKITLLLVLPTSVLRRIPLRSTKLAAQSHDDFEKYLTEALNERIEEAQSGARNKVGMDLVGQLARSSYGSEEGGKDKDAALLGPQHGKLTREEIIGNAFIMLVAGHETSANVLHFSLVELAANPASQRRLHEDIDELVGDTEPESWDYEGLVNKMMASMLGAVMNETLRLMPPVVDIPKMVSAERDQVVTMDGKEYRLPKDSGIAVMVASVHRNPQYWPTQESKIHAGKSDIDDFVPERWLEKSPSPLQEKGKEEGDADAVTSAQLFRPTPGAFIPFSGGSRSCIGRRFAQVEIVAMLAVLFQRYSVELAVDEWASDDEVSRMTRQEARDVYAKAQAKSRATLAGSATLLTLKLQGDKHVPVRLVRRGSERFVSWL